MRTSMTITAKSSVSSRLSASSPEVAVTTSRPSGSSTVRSATRLSAWSSTTRIGPAGVIPSAS